MNEFKFSRLVMIPSVVGGEMVVTWKTAHTVLDVYTCRCLAVHAFT